ncbi:Uncharacterized protein SCF082_LOCUS22806 [Durusdinium trenchii]|uniref:Uncharacterized protein n=1 Tax=Durusdinium trenchii TaxID=1381693 RepID=A0ABP0LKX1_9DINO
MKTELKWSPERIKAAVAYCTHPSRVKTHVRRDKYQPTIKEYWVDVATTGSFEEEHEESLTDRTTGEGLMLSRRAVMQKKAMSLAVRYGEINGDWRLIVLGDTVGEVTEKDACALAQAFWNEFSPLLEPGARPPSAEFLSVATRLADTGHENRFTDACLTKFGLSANIEMSYYKIKGLKDTHPVLPIAATLRALDAKGKLDLLLMGHGPSTFNAFWDKFWLLQKGHPVFENHHGRLGDCIPIGVHCDEGTTLKKKSIMLIQWQPLIGKGSRKRKGTATDPGVNMLGDSITSRFVWSVMLARLYANTKGKVKNKPLLDLVSCLSEELSRAFYEGVRLQECGRRLYLVPLCLKGDWPALAKIGTLTRHFGRKSDAKPGHGICHLCRADMEGFKDWHDVSFANMQAMREDLPMPWLKEPTVVCCYDFDLYGPGSFDFQIDNLFEDLKAFCVRNSLQLHMSGLSRTLLGFATSSEYPAGNWFKGQDTVTLLLFLEHRFESAVREVEPHVVAFFQEMFNTIKAANANVFLKSLYRTALWLTSEERDCLLKSGHECIRGFQQCAEKAFELELPRFKYQTKLHMYGEILFGLENERHHGQPSLSPLVFATQLDEDLVGKVSSMSRTVSVRTVHTRTLAKYQLALAARW